MATKIVEDLHLGREMREVVDSQRSFDAAHFVDHLLEAIVSEWLMLVFLEVFAESIEFVFGYNAPERRPLERKAHTARSRVRRVAPTHRRSVVRRAPGTDGRADRSGSDGLRGGSSRLDTA